MMNQERTKSVAGTKYLLFVPLTALLLIAGNIEMAARTGKRIAENVTEMWTTEASARGVDQVEPALEMADQMPEYPGGVPALMQYLSTNLRYPVTAFEKKIQGNVIVRFVIDKDGTPTDFNVKRGVDPMLDAEAIRVLSAMPKWTPGKHQGKIVRVYYTMPIAFKLDKGAEAPAANVRSNKPLVAVESGSSKNGAPVFEAVEMMPEYPGGQGALMKFLAENLKYPVNAQEREIQGTSIVEMIVGKDGTLSDARIVRSADPDLDAEALRVISLMPKWKPGMQKGEPVNVKFTIPIKFKLGPEKAMVHTIQFTPPVVKKDKADKSKPATKRFTPPVITKDKPDSTQKSSGK